MDLGKIAEVDLTSGRVTYTDSAAEMAETYLGATAAADALPDKFLHEPIVSGPAGGRRVRELKYMVSDFYRSTGWDDQGVPTKEKLAELGIS